MSLNPHDILPCPLPPLPAPPPRKSYSWLHCSDGELEAKSGHATCPKCPPELCLGRDRDSGCRTLESSATLSPGPVCLWQAAVPSVSSTGTCPTWDRCARGAPFTLQLEHPLGAPGLRREPSPGAWEWSLGADCRPPGSPPHVFP